MVLFEIGVYVFLKANFGQASDNSSPGAGIGMLEGLLTLGVGFIFGLGIVGTYAEKILDRNYSKIPGGLRIYGLLGYLLLPVPFLPIVWLGVQK